MEGELADKTQLNRPDIDQDKEIDKGIKANHFYFELIDNCFDSFAVNFACNFTYIFGSVVYKLISLTLRLGRLCDNIRFHEVSVLAAIDGRITSLIHLSLSFFLFQSAIALKTPDSSVET